MHDFDLIPPCYHERRRWRRVLVSSAVAYVVLAVLTGGLLWHLHRDVDDLQRAANRERGRQTVAETLTIERRRVLDERRLVETRLAVLRDLQRPAPLRAALALIEQTVVEGILLDAWTLDATLASDDAPAASEHAAATEAATAPAARMRIVGDARTHADLLRYIARLTTVNHGGPVEVLRSSMAPAAAGVSFELSLTLHAGRGEAG